MTMPTDHHAERVRQHRDAVETIQQARSAIESEQREPDQWERENLVMAIGLILRAGYRAVAPIVEHALTPPDQHVPIPDDPTYKPLDLEGLKRALANAAAQPVRDNYVAGGRG